MSHILEKILKNDDITMSILQIIQKIFYLLNFNIYVLLLK